MNEIAFLRPPGLPQGGPPGHLLYPSLPLGQGSTDSTRKGPTIDHTSMDVVGHYVHVNLDTATGQKTELGKYMQNFVKKYMCW